MLRIVHGADFHLDSPFRGITPAAAAQRREEQRALFARLVALAHETEADLILLSGDLLDGKNAFYETAEGLQKALASVRARVFISPGNHDCLSGRSIYLRDQWPENVHIFRKETIEAVLIPEHNCVVYGAGFMSSVVEHSLLQGFSTPKDGRIHVMVLHGEAEVSEGRYNPISKKQIEESGLTYLALGHQHTYSGIRKAGRTVYAWPGCPEGRGFDETGEKGVICGTISLDGVDLGFVPLCARRYEVLKVDITGKDPMEAVERALPSITTNDIYRIVLSGEAENLQVEKLREGLSKRFYHLRLLDETKEKEDMWRREREDNLVGFFLREMKERLLETESEEERLQILDGVRYGLAALEGREEPSLRSGR